MYGGNRSLVVRLPFLVIALCLSALPAYKANSVSCQTGPFILFFDKNSAFVDSKSREILDNAIAAAENCFARYPQIAGHTDKVEGPEVGQMRVAVVTKYLEARGFPSANITGHNFRSERPRISERGRDEEPENRRIELMLWHQYTNDFSY